MATSPTLPAISQAPNLHLVGFVAAYYLPQEDLAAEPLVAGGAVVGDLQLVAGAGWHKLPYTPNTLKLEETPKTERGVTTYQLRVSAQRPQPDPGVLAALEALNRRKLLLLLVEPGGGRRLIGSTEEYMQLLTSGEGQNAATKAGLELRFEGTTTHLAYYYTGEVPVLTGPAVGPAPGGSGGYVEIRSKTGALMARVPAGATVTILSGFRVKLSF